MKRVVLPVLLLAVLAITSVANSAGPIFFTKNVVVASDSKELIAGLAESGRKLSKEDFKTLVMDMVLLREAVLLPKGLTIQCVFDCGDHFLGKIINTSFSAWNLIGQEFWFIIITVEPNVA